MDFSLLAAVLEHADAAIVACDAHGRNLVFNTAARKLFGAETLPADHALFRALRDGAPVRTEMPIAGGLAVVSAVPLLDTRGNKLGAVATCATLSGALNAERKRLELLIESTGEGIYCIDLDGKCTFANGSAAAMLGHSRESLPGQPMHSVMHHTKPSGQPYPVEECPIYRAFREGRGCRMDDELFFRVDGSSFPVEYSSYPIVDGGVVQGAVVTFNDITARKRTEAALRQSEAKYRSLFETVSEGVYQTSPGGELLAANRALIEMLGYASENELRAMDVNDLYMNPEDRKRLTAQLERDGKLVDEQFELKRKDGRVIRVIESARAVSDERQRVIYYEGTLRLL